MRFQGSGEIMTKHFEREITLLKRRILTTGSMVEQMLREAVRSVEEGDPAAARWVIDQDAAVDAEEVANEEECLKILALHQPVALSLRFVTAVLKINNDLERMADQAVNIAERALRLLNRATPALRMGLHEIAERAMSMVRRALDALVALDKDAALQVCRSDAEVDALYRTACEGIEHHIQRHPGEVSAGLDMVAVLANLERCADLATNIAEDVVYTVGGQIIRHPGLARRSDGTP
jgi:phosphate transport system protein